MPTPNIMVGLEERMRDRSNVWKPPDIYWHLANVRAFLSHLLPKAIENRCSQPRWGVKADNEFVEEGWGGHSGYTVEMYEAKPQNVKTDSRCCRRRCTNSKAQGRHRGLPSVTVPCLASSMADYRGLALWPVGHGASLTGAKRTFQPKAPECLYSLKESLNSLFLQAPCSPTLTLLLRPFIFLECSSLHSVNLTQSAV